MNTLLSAIFKFFTTKNLFKCNNVIRFLYVLFFVKVYKRYSILMFSYCPLYYDAPQSQFAAGAVPYFHIVERNYRTAVCRRLSLIQASLGRSISGAEKPASSA